MQAVLKTWGNSKAVRLPSKICTALNIKEGAKAEVHVDELSKSVTLQFKDEHPRKYRRTQKLTLEEIMQNWTGPKLGGELDDTDVGAEVVL